MKDIIETRVLKISDKILKSDDIRKLFSDIETEIDKLKLKTDKEVEQLLSSKKNSLTDEDYENEVRWKTKGRRWLFRSDHASDFGQMMPL